MMKNLAITGVSGYIGGRLLSRLVETKSAERIVGIDLTMPRLSSPALSFYRHNILEPLDYIFMENEVDSAVHLAFAMKPTRDARGARRVDVDGALNFLEACRQSRVKHILYLSSHTVYGAYPGNAGFFSEDSPLRPLPGFQYSQDKAEVERILADFATSNKDVRVTVLRSCPVIGPNAAKSAVASMFRSVMIQVAGCDPLMQFVHEDDLAKVIMACLAQEKGGVYNVAGDGEIRYSDIARLSRKKSVALPDKVLGSLMGFSWALHLQNASPASGLEFIKYPLLMSTEKLKKELGFRFSYSSRAALESFLSARR